MIDSTTVTTGWLNSGVVYLAGHGSQSGNEVMWINSRTNLNYRVSNYALPSQMGCNVNDADLTNCKLAIMAACYSGLANGIAQSFQENGADCAIGWKASVSNVTMARYNKILTSYLADGATIQNAIKGANADIEEESDIWVDENIFNYQTYGSGVYNTIKRNSNKNTDKLDIFKNMDIFSSVDKNAEGIYNSDTFVNELSTYDKVKEKIEYRNGDDTEIASYIHKNVDSRFDKSLFILTEIETIPGDASDMIITYRYNVGGVPSDFGYNINIENYKMVGIKEIGNDLYGFEAPYKVTEAMKTEKLRDFNKKSSDNQDAVKEQYVDAKFNSKDKSFVYLVKTIYETKDGGIYCTYKKV